MKNLVIVESPTKARTLSRFLGPDYQIEATMGHVRDLPKSKLGIDVEHDFKPLYQTIGNRKKEIQKLRDAAFKAENIILATDPDREGEAIAWHVAYILTKNSKFEIRNSKFKRIVFHEITQSAIKDALLHTREIDMKLVDAQQARRVLDRLVGYKLSPLLWNKIGKNWLSAGRVQSVAVRLIVEREREIKAFVPVEYWVVEVELQKAQSVNLKAQNESSNSFIARLTFINDQKAEIKNKETADTVVTDLKGATYLVKNVETKDIRRFPAPPFTTSVLQQTASNRYGWSAKRTMQTAQKLYEEGFITYHRTDSTNLSAESIEMVRGYIKNAFGDIYVPLSPRLYKTKSKVAQEAHEAIRPTDVGQFSNSKLQITNTLGREAERLYELIWKRFVACQMNEAIFEQTGVDVEGKSVSQQISQSANQSVNEIRYLLRATGQRVKFDGWMAAYGSKAQSANVKDQNLAGNNIRGDDVLEENKELPKLLIGDLLNLLQLLPQQKFTEPPPRFNEASLIKILEEKGIGRPSTYAPIISTIQDRKYVEKMERKFYPTDLGYVVNDFLVKYFPDIFDISFTAKMEDDLDKIANGEMQWGVVIHEFYDPMAVKIQVVYKDAEKVKVSYGTTDEKCPNGGHPLVVRMSKYGKFLACSTFPRCKFTKTMVEKAGISCPSCGGDIIVKKTRRGKQFYGCSNYPTCTFAAWKKEDIVKSTNNPINQ